jgi:hypothetical protein
MERKYGYYWVKWDKWVIAQWCYDDEDNKDFWCWSGMEITCEPEEVDERKIVRDSVLVQPQ